jgi:hypothetical protein
MRMKHRNADHMTLDGTGKGGPLCFPNSSARHSVLHTPWVSPFRSPGYPAFPIRHRVSKESVSSNPVGHRRWSNQRKPLAAWAMMHLHERLFSLIVFPSATLLPPVLVISEILLLVEEIRSRRSQIYNLWTPITVLFKPRAFLGISC